MADHNSIECAIKRCQDLLNPNTITEGPSKNLKDHIETLADCMCDLNDIVQDIEIRVTELENEN